MGARRFVAGERALPAASTRHLERSTSSPITRGVPVLNGSGRRRLTKLLSDYQRPLNSQRSIPTRAQPPFNTIPITRPSHAPFKSFVNRRAARVRRRPRTLPGSYRRTAIVFCRRSVLGPASRPLLKPGVVHDALWRPGLEKCPPSRSTRRRRHRPIPLPMTAPHRFHRLFYSFPERDGLEATRLYRRHRRRLQADHLFGGSDGRKQLPSG